MRIWRDKLSELKSCPFCGGEVETKNMLGGITGFVCACGAVISFMGAENFEDAVKMWNTREKGEVE